MDILGLVYGSISWLLPFLVVLTILVFFHELGHYWFARRHGVRIEVFSIGFGPEVFGWTDKNQTRWKFSLIPLGGYVKMFGDDDASSTPDREAQKEMTPEEKSLTLDGKTLGQKASVVAAGPFANILITILCFWAVYAFKGEPLDIPVVGHVIEGGAAHSLGLKKGDKITHVAGQPLGSFNQLRRAIAKYPDEMVQLTYMQEGQTFTQYIKPTDKGGYGVIGIIPMERSHTVVTALWGSLKSTAKLSLRMLKMFGSLITGKEDAKKLGGLPTIAKMSHDAWGSGLFALLSFMALLSLNLGIINLLPVPVLDGGHLFFYAIEAIRGRPVSMKVQDIAYKIGFYLLISLMLFSHWNDFVRFKWISGIQNFLTRIF